MNLSDFRFSLENPNFCTATFLERGKRASRVSNSDSSSAFSPIINYVIGKEVLAPKSFQSNRFEAGRQAGLQFCSRICCWMHCFLILCPVHLLFLKENGGTYGWWDRVCILRENITSVIYIMLDTYFIYIYNRLYNICYISINYNILLSFN